MSRRIYGRQLWLIVLALLAMAWPAAAQDGSLQGTVRDATGKPVAGATVTITYTQSGRNFVSKTDKNGNYLQIGLVQGQYSVTVEQDKLKVSQPFMVRGARRNMLDLVLASGPVGGAGEPDPRIAQLNKAFDEGLAASRAGDNDGAIAKFNEALTINPNCSDCYMNIGAAQLRKKAYADAEAAYKKVIELKPDSSDAYLGLASVYNAERKFDEANEASKKATELSAAAPGATGGSPDALYNQGVILFNQGKTADAAPLFEQAITAKPDFADAHYMLGMSMAGSDPAKAVAEFQEYLKLDPSGKNAALAKQFVDALKK
jgi:tetratricopeptide (TPR) repeat protein